jgi:Ni,Fe-hydrogenase III small subunit/Pyruvate/2-oxoacid:ferredoxin oxidoreductase delta subunit
MFKVILARLQQGHRTMRYPDGPPPAMPDRFRGRPSIVAADCPDGCQQCAEACPTGAVSVADGVRIDLGRCLFCASCVEACPENAIVYTPDYRLAVRNRDDLLVVPAQQELQLAAAMGGQLRRLLGRSLRLRQVSAGGCNACEADVNVLNTLAWDLSRFGIQFVASPRHADGLLVTGPVTRNMELALRKTYEAVPGPKIVIAVGACAVSGGPFRDLDQVNNGADAFLPVDLYVPGCPPHPLTILDGLLRLIGRIDNDAAPLQPAAASAGVSDNSTGEDPSAAARLRRWWQRFRPFVEEYLRKNEEDQAYWGTRRAERELSIFGFPPSPSTPPDADQPPDTPPRARNDNDQAAR